MENYLDIYNKLRKVPDEAKKAIQGGRLKGKTDINPMWRIKVLTEQFGPCGIGWKYIIKDKVIIDGSNGEKAAFVDIELFYKNNDQWSEAIPGTGGSMFVENESKGLYVNDECYKMALTDAISVAGKAIGLAGDVYFEKDTSSKYEVKEKKVEEVNYKQLVKERVENLGFDFKSFCVEKKLSAKTTQEEAKVILEELNANYR